MFRRSKTVAPGRIEIYLENLEQFFNSMDPSPFHEKDLDDNAEEFIVSWAEEFQFNDPIVLVIHLSRYPTNIDPQQVVEKAVHNHFAYKVRLNRLFSCSVSGTVRAIIHLNETQALEPLERNAEWKRAELPETYPSVL
jgi:hypothetical protein